jgi:hypothetical protein
MPVSRKPGAGEVDETPGLAGGPGPTPPGVEDGTATPRAEPERMAPPPPAEKQQAEGEAAERQAADRADVRPRRRRG